MRSSRIIYCLSEEGQVLGATFLDYWGEYRDIFVVIHECAHMVFGWPDLYTKTGTRGTGAYDLMSSEVGIVGIPNASLLWEEGWVEALDITQSQRVTLSENGNRVVRFVNPYRRIEFFILEARNKNTSLTSRLPGADRGLFIWHIDRDVYGNHAVDWMKGEHYGVALEQTDGRLGIEYNRNSGDNGDAFTPGTTFSPSSNPNSHWVNNTRSGFTVHAIELGNDGTISFDVVVE
ncbi:MAG: hypothetical protein OCD01_18565 [Fibrobacterales bacterium]